MVEFFEMILGYILAGALFLFVASLIIFVGWLGATAILTLGAIRRARKLGNVKPSKVRAIFELLRSLLK